MKRGILMLATAVLLSACSTTRMSDADTLDLYKAHAGEPVRDFQYFGQINGWTPIGDSALTVWTRPSQAYLLELYGPCQDLDYAPAIGVSSFGGRVSARFDSVQVLGGGTSSIRIACRIETIRPLDVKALKQAQKDLREAKLVEREAASS
ncbi:MAG: DUF6491 family protein [Pseudoxanthomonas sp.]